MLKNEKNIKLTSFIDIDFLQEFQDFFAKTIDVASIAVDDVGPITKPSNFTDFCAKYTRGSTLGLKRCVECDIKWGKIAAEKGKPVVYKCHTGLTDFAVPIILDGKHIASILGGQVLTEPPNEDQFRAIARELGINEDEYIAEVRKIKIIPLKQIKAAADLMYFIANSISVVGHKNLELFKKNEREAFYTSIVETIRDTLDIEETKKKIVEVIGKTLNADRCFIIEYDKKSEKFLTVKDEYLSSDEVISFTNEDVNELVPNFAEAFKNGKPLIINNKEISIDSDNKNFDMEKLAIEKYNVNSAFAFPLFYRNELLGTLVLHYVDKNHGINEGKIRLLNAIANQIAIAFYQARLYKTTQMAAKREALLRNIIAAIRKTLNINELKMTIVNEVGKALNADRVFLVVIDSEKNTPGILDKYSEYLSSPDEVSLVGFDFSSPEVKFFANIHKQSKSIIINDIDEYVKENNLKNSEEEKWLQKTKSKSGMGIPIFYGEKVYGVLSIHFTKTRVIYSDDQKKFLETLANQIGIALHQARLFEKEKIQAEREKLIRKIIETTRSTLDLDDTKNRIVEIIGKTLNADRCFILEYDKKNDNFSIVNNQYLSSNNIISYKGLDVNKLVPNFLKASREGKNIIINDKHILTENENVDFNPEISDYIEKYKINSAFACPLFYNNELIGELVIHYVDNIHYIDNNEIEFLNIISGQIATALYHAKLYETIQLQTGRETILRKIIESSRKNLISQDVLRDICEEIINLFKVGRVSIGKLSQDSANKPFATVECLANDKIKTFKDIPDSDIIFRYWRNYLLQKGGIKPIANIDKSDLPDDVKKVYQELGIKSMMAVPLVSQDYSWGGLVLSKYDSYKEWSDEDVELLETIASQAFIAIRQAELYEKEKQTAERELLLRKIIEIIRSSLDINIVKHEMVFQIGALLKADRVAFADYDSIKENYFILEGNEYKYSKKVKTFIGYDFAATPGFIDSIKEIHITGNDIIFSDLDKYLEENNLKGTGIEDFYRDMGFMSSMAINISHGNSFYGNLVITFETKRNIDVVEIEFIKILANQAGIALYQAELFEKEKKTAERDTLLRKTIETIRSSLDINEIKSSVISLICKAFNADRCYFRAYDTVKEKFLPVDTEYLSSPDIKSMLNAESCQECLKYFAHELMAQNKGFYPIMFNEVSAKNTPLEAYFKSANIKADYATPISVREEEILWLVLHYSKEDPKLSEDNLKLLETIAYQMDIAFNQVRLFNIVTQTAQNEKALREIMLASVSTFDVETVKKTIVTAAGVLFKADRCFFAVLDPESELNCPIEGCAEYLSSPDIKSHTYIMPGKDETEDFIKESKLKKVAAVDDITEIDLPEATMRMLVDDLSVKSYLTIPVFYADDMYGTLVFHYVNEFQHFTQDEIDMAQSIAYQSAIVIHQAELYKITKLQTEREALLIKITETIRSSLDIEETLSFICEETAKIFNVQRSAIAMFTNPENFEESVVRKEFISAPGIKGISQSEIFLKISAYWGYNLMKTDDVLAFDNLMESDTPEYFKDYYNFLGIKSMMGTSIRKGNNEWGALVLSEYNNYRHWTEEEKTLLDAISSQIYIAINQAELFENQKKTAEKERRLRNIFEIMRSSLDINVTKNKIVTEIGKTLNMDICFIMIYDPVENNFNIDEYSEYRSSSSEKSFVGENSEAPEFKFFMHSYKNNQEVNFPDAEEYIAKNNLQDAPEANFLRSCNIKSSYNIPVYYANTLLGVIITLYTKDYRVLDKNELDFLRTIADQSGIAIHQARLYKITQIQVEREKISKNMIEILRSTLDKNIIKHLFVKNIGEFFKADRVFFSDYDSKRNMYLPVDKNSEYLSSSLEKSFVNFDFSDDSIRGFIQPLLEKRELKILSWDEYIKDKPKTDVLITRFENANVKSSYNLPVLYQGQIMGYFCIEFTHAVCKLSDEDINRIRNICVQAGIALYHADLLINAQEATRSKAEFIANISNEFKIPLNFIIEFSETLSKYEFERSKEIEYLNYINKNGKQLLALTDDIIDISEIESEKFILHYEHFDSEELIREVVSSMQLTADNKNINIDINLSKVNINADRKMLARIIHIILSNAIRFTQVQGNIIIKSELDGDNLVVFVEDTGISTPSDNRDMIFEEVKQVDTSLTKRQQGAGLGLSIAKKLVELHQGTIHVEAVGNKGSRFWFVLPKAYV